MRLLCKSHIKCFFLYFSSKTTCFDSWVSQLLFALYNVRRIWHQCSENPQLFMLSVNHEEAGNHWWRMFWHVYVLPPVYFVWPWSPHKFVTSRRHVWERGLWGLGKQWTKAIRCSACYNSIVLQVWPIPTSMPLESKRRQNTINNKVNVYLSSLRTKVPDHLYVLGHSYTCQTLIKYNRYA
jgi:hypothetical protein